MARLLTLLCATTLLAVPPCARAAGASPPLLTRNQYAPFLAFYDPPPLPAGHPREWRLAAALDYSSLFQDQGDSQTGGVVDMELARLALHAGRRVGRRLAVDIEVPFIWTGGGFLDDFVSDWHSTFGLPNGNRDRAPSDLHRYRLTIGGDKVIDSDQGGAGLGDLSASLTFLITRSDAPIAAAVRIGMKAPTAGDELSLRGSGGWDYALGLIGEGRWSAWSAAVHLAAVYPTGVAEVDVEPFATGLLNLTWQFVDGLDLVGELAGRTSPFDTGVEIFDDPALELRLGVRKTVGHISAIEVAFVEDLTHRTTPDFSVHLAWRLTPGEWRLRDLPLRITAETPSAQRWGMRPWGQRTREHSARGDSQAPSLRSSLDPPAFGREPLAPERVFMGGLAEDKEHCRASHQATKGAEKTGANLCVRCASAVSP